MWALKILSKKILRVQLKVKFFQFYIYYMLGSKYLGTNVLEL